MKRLEQLFCRSRLMRTIAFSLFAFTASLTHAAAQTTTFADFVEVGGTQDFTFTNDGGLGGTLGTVSGGSAVNFTFQNVAGLPVAITGPQAAHLFISGTTNVTASNIGGILSQPVNDTIVIQIIRDTPAPSGVGGGSRTNLLTVVITPAGQVPAIVGADAGTTAALSVTTPSYNISFTSQFLSFASVTQRNVELNFSSVAPALSVGDGGILASFTAVLSGSFSAGPLPIYSATTAANVSVGGRVLGINGQGLRNAEVLLLEQDGTRRTTRTDTFGYFRFDELAGGQGVTISVKGKRSPYATQFVSLTDNALDLVFTPNQ